MHHEESEAEYAGFDQIGLTRDEYYERLEEFELDKQLDSLDVAIEELRKATARIRELEAEREHVMEAREERDEWRTAASDALTQLGEEGKRLASVRGALQAILNLSPPFAVSERTWRESAERIARAALSGGDK